MLRRLQTPLLAAALLSAPALFAHDAKLHAGNATEGQIVSIAGNNVVMKTAKGDVKVTLNKSTKFEMGTQVVDVNHFKMGDKIAVIGTKLATGEIVAKEMIMPAAATKSAVPADHKH